jgi:hypothetical protein
MNDPLSVALKEWAVVVEALERGDQIFLLRKGGLADRGPSFEATHSEFLLYPTTEHQRPEWLAEPFRHRPAAIAPEPQGDGQRLTFTSAARVVEARTVPSREALDALAGEHIWSPAHLDQRWSYKPERPLALWILRVYRLAEPRTVPYLPRYAGCRSWVPLGEGVPLPAWTPALDEAELRRRRARIEAALGPFAR